MLFARKRGADFKDNLNITLDGGTIKYVNECKNLGLIIDDKLRFRAHVNSCIRKAFSNLKYIYIALLILFSATYCCCKFIYPFIFTLYILYLYLHV